MGWLVTAVWLGLCAVPEGCSAEVVYPLQTGSLKRILDVAAVPGHVFILHPEALAQSADEGATWSLQKIPNEPRSLFFLDPLQGWMVAANGLYGTQDGGRKWKRLLKSRDLLRCWFVTPAHGYAVGDRKSAVETTDGGKAWHALEPATGILSDPERTSFTSVEFSGRTGFIGGYHTPKRPARDSTGRQWPQLGVLVQTVDGGETWKPTASAVFGRLERASVGGRTAALVLQFDFDFGWPSEVYRIDLPTGETRREYRDAEHRVCAAAVIGSAVAVAAVRVGKNRATGPRPVELRLAGVELEIDDRLTGSSCYLQPSGSILWLATDEGFLDKIPVL